MLTPKQKQIFEYVKKYLKEKDYSPSLEEIGEKFGLVKSTVHQHIKALIEKGYINKLNYQARTIEISKNKRNDSVKIPILGTIAAGKPIEAIEIPKENISIARSEINVTNDYYALKVAGNSMIDEGIFDRDIVIIKKQQTADDGQTVVAIIDDNQATLKKIYREKNGFRLQPANQGFLPLYRTEVEIRGVVVKIIRELESIQYQENELTKLMKMMPLTTDAYRTATSNPNDKAKPFIQWVGGKREVIPQYIEFIPKKFNTYYEPFLGGGAMFFYLRPENAVLSDNNTELIKTYEGIRDNPEEVIKILRELKSKHSQKLYLRVRDLDRDINILHELNNAEIAARMIYLNQTCFNGLYRVNKKGQFNVPIGSSLNRLICDEHTLRNASEALKNIVIKEADFNISTINAKKDDLLYFDPPYHPVSIYSDFTRYTKEKFYKEDQIRLKKEINRLNKIGCKIMLSNSDCKFIRDLYIDFNIHKVHSGRLLNCKKDRRGKISELLITNY